MCRGKMVVPSTIQPRHFSTKGSQMYNYKNEDAPAPFPSFPPTLCTPSFTALSVARLLAYFRANKTGASGDEDSRGGRRRHHLRFNLF